MGAVGVGDLPPPKSCRGQVGDAWTFLILREAFFGVRRFDGFQKGTGAAPTVLTQRLKALVRHGLLEKRRYSERPPRFEYRLTEKGLDLYPAIVLMMRWGDRWLAGTEGPPIILVHRTCGQPMAPHPVCDHCGGRVKAREVVWQPGPGMAGTADEDGGGG